MFVLIKLCSIFILLIGVQSNPDRRKSYSELKSCDVGPLAEEIASYESVVKEIINYVTNGPFKGKTYDELSKFVDTFGARPSGSQVLEDSIDYIIQLTKEEDINDIVTQELEVPLWMRGKEEITMIEPRKKNIDLLGLGQSVSTPPEGITAEVIVVHNFDELSEIPYEDVEGKIVLYDPIFTTYGETVAYRSHGAVRAAEKGAVASLVRSIAPFSINSPHTGLQYYNDNVKRIPTAAISIEDADLMRRLFNRGKKIVLNITMTSTSETKTSRNTLIDLKGSLNPEKLVIVSGHIDSWDVGQGAMDDGGGLFVSWAVPVILKQLNMKPKRTIRSIFWTAEELGLIGAYAYEEKHRNESHNINFIMESDEGTFAPRGLVVGGNQKARCIIAEILKLFESINASTLVEADSPGTDISVLVKTGIPGASLHNANEKYLWFHHTEGDTMNVESPEELDLCTAFWTACYPDKIKSYSELKSCDIGPLAEEIASYESVVKEIINYVTNGPFKGKTYDELSKFVDTFGARPSGSQVLEDSIDYMIQLTKEEDINDIVTEELEVPHWMRGKEEITMIEPRKKNIDLLGLGQSVSTPPEGISAEVIVVHNFDELSEIPYEDVEGKIVLYDPIFTTYGETVVYRSQGAVRAAEKGAVASLVRSIAPFSINSPHTGSQYYNDNVKKIPSAAISIEDADLMRRLFNRGKKIVLNITMMSSSETKTSRNTLIDLKGSLNPEKLVIVSGHIDSWDVGQGAMDDGGGLFVSWAVPVILKQLNMKPKRTIRSIFWTAEELGLIGAYAYEEKHRNESHNINFIMESDEGTFSPLGLVVGGSQEARCIIAEILKLFESINASTLVESDSPGSDISVLIKTGIPGASLHNANEKYFWFHHTEGDTMNVENPEELDLCAAFWTAVAYIIADISADIPR
ncbi:unnamed protein product [Danaus chrysippus]|uniref:Carboxypeptidase Q n=1 Tax=Danaus chrysippus TaxID=151541 RepID=A0A8J2QHQ8_9NEOP|nr:unnamed protein product [Danaus chrysippus]